jgi:hypothetical protein
MSVPIPSNGSAHSNGDGEWVVTVTNGLVTRIERVDSATQTRAELSEDQYAWVTASQYSLYCALYYAGIRDYIQALASGNTEVAQAYYQGMTEFLGPIGQA